MPSSLPHQSDLFNKNEQDQDSLYIVSYIFTLGSLTFGAAVLYIFTKSRASWTHMSKMTICLTVANLIYTVSNLLSLINIDMLLWKEFIGALETFSMLSCVFWATRIAMVGFRAILKNTYNPDQSVDFKWGFYAPLIVSIIPTFHNKYLGYSKYGIDSDVSSSVPALNVIMPTVIYIIPMVLSMGLSIYYYIRIIQSINDVANRLGISMVKFVMCPLCLLLSWLPMTICRIAFLFGYYGVWLDAIGIIFSRSSGFINAIVYGWDHFKLMRDSANAKQYESDCDYESTFHDDEYCVISSSL